MRGGPRAAPGGGDAGPAPRVDVGAAFAVFAARVDGWSTRTLRLPPSAGAPVEFSYQDPDPAHARATHRLLLDPGTLAVVAHERFEARPAGQRFVSAMFPLHSGSYFGQAGLLVFCLASLAMPLFTITGFQLYLDRRAKKRAGEQRRRDRELALARRSAG
jgi:sulfite reductase (NADPH) flavoprotein alpha-component